MTEVLGLSFESFFLRLFQSQKCFLWTANSDSMSMVATHRKEFIGELALLSKLRHPNIMQFLGAVTKSQPLVIVTEYLPKVIAQVYFPLLIVCGCGCDD